MSILQNSNAISAGGYDINNSLRFRSSASAYLNRTPASASNRTTWTWSGWVKRGALGIDGTFFDAANNDQFRWRSDDTFSVAFNNTLAIQTTQVFRDPSAWYHFVVVADTTQATASNRIKLYVNGVQVTAFSTASYPAQNTAGFINSVNAHNLGRVNSGAYYIDGYMAEVNFIDGQALTPSSFGETDAITGSWVAKKYTGTYGTNGFYLKFSDIATTSGSNAGLGKDFSGNSNYWTTNNISVTSGTTYDAMTDSPTNTSATVANYCVLNPLKKGSTLTISDGNLKVTASGTFASDIVYGTIGISSGKWYWEGTSSSSQCWMVGIINANSSATAYSGLSSGISYAYGSDGTKYNGQTSTSFGNTYTSGDVVMCAFDADTGKIWFGKNGTWQASGDPVAGTNPAFNSIASDIWTAIVLMNGTGGSIGNSNFGQRPFTYTPPTGFKALNTYNLPDSTIKKGNSYMDATLYTGNGSAGTDVQTITNAGSFKPDLVWTKSRSGAYSHHIGDSVRGIDKTLFSNTTGAEATYTYDIHAFNSNGFTVGNDGSQNTSGQTYVGWQWQAGQGTTSSGTGTGGITSVSYSVSTTAGFSVVIYTGSGSVGTVTHGLGVAPKMIIIKNRGVGTAGNGEWQVYHASLGNTQYLALNTTAAAATATNRWNNTSPTSSVFTVATTGSVNDPSNTYVAYCFAEIAGFSKFGSYTGNGSSDGPFVYTGFRPKWIMIKNTINGAAEWNIWDSSRNTYNLVNGQLVANTYDAEVNYNTADFLSNGFKVRSTYGNTNGSGQLMIYAAFAENPFKNANAR